MKMDWNDNWYFTRHYSDSLKTITRQRAQLDLEEVRIPHTVWMQELNYCPETDYQMESGYVHFLEAPLEWEGKRVLLTFGAAAHEAEVFCNGERAGLHRSGYTAFTVDLSRHLRYGEDNLVTVRLDSRENLNIPPFGRVIDYMTYGGLYRGITLEVKESSCLGEVFVYGTMDLTAHVSVFGLETEGCEMSAQITGGQPGFGKNPEVMAEWERSPFIPEFSLAVPDALLWDVRHPNLYTLTVRLWRDGVQTDCLETRFGFRQIRFTGKGCYLNGRRIKLRGLNRHQSWPYMGYAVPDRAQRLDADILKYELGCNAVRTSHYPQSQAFLDRCDEIGLMVFTEFPGWQYVGDEDWKRQALENEKEMILQYRNHPSIFMWGVRINESQDDEAFYRRTNELAHQLDPTRPTGGVRFIKKSQLLEDVYTYNDFSHNGTNEGTVPKKTVTDEEEKGYLISEYNGHMFPTKAFDWEEKRLEHALRHARVLDSVKGDRQIAGSFGWCMFDYNTHQDFGSGDRICYHGVRDMFRNPTLAAAGNAAEGSSRPVLETSSSMDIGDHPAGSLGKVYAFTNADEVELYKNGQFVKTFTPGDEFPNMKHPPIEIDDVVGELLERKEGYDRRTAEDVKKVLFAVAKYGQDALPVQVKMTAARLMAFKHFTFEKGNELFGKYIGNWGGERTCWEFVAKRAGREVARVVRASAGHLHLEVRTDTQKLCENGTWDMATVRIRALDEYGNTVPYLTRALSLETEGEIERIGPAHPVFSGGMTGTYVRTTGRSGKGTLTICCDGMESVKLDFTCTGIADDRRPAASEPV